MILPHILNLILIYNNLPLSVLDTVTTTNNILILFYNLFRNPEHVSFLSSCSNCSQNFSLANFRASYTALLASLLACSYAFLWPFTFCLSLVFLDSIQILNKFLFSSVILAIYMFHY